MDGGGGTVPSEAPEILVPEGVADADARSTLERLLGPELDAERRAAPLEYRVVEETRHHSQTPTQCEQRRAKKSEEQAWDVRALKLPLLLGARAEAEARQRILETIPHPLLAVARNGRVPPLDVACHRIKCMSECVLSPMFRPVVAAVAVVVVVCARVVCIVAGGRGVHFLNWRYQARSPLVAPPLSLVALSLVASIRGGGGGPKRCRIAASSTCPHRFAFAVRIHLTNRSLHNSGS
jgi:hypothetical protein